ncbi:MAG TPA: hypothetical protein VKC64_12710 [Burkholderiales bacterium]|nr:hypothetical protein [Burkholderiales bacterium]
MGSAMQTLRQKTALRLANRERTALLPASVPQAKRRDPIGTLRMARAFVAHALEPVRSAIRERLGM